jgi:hypothetical protein
MSPSDQTTSHEIPINFTYVWNMVGSISDLYEMDFGDPLPLDASIPQSYLDRAYRPTAERGCLEIAYLVLTYLLQSEDEDLARFHMGEREWSREEMRHLIQEIKSNWFPTPQPQLDALASCVVFSDSGGNMETWWKIEVPKLVAMLPKIQ